MKIEITLIKRIEVNNEKEALNEVDKLMKLGGDDFSLRALELTDKGHKKVMADS